MFKWKDHFTAYDPDRDIEIKYRSTGDWLDGVFPYIYKDKDVSFEFYARVNTEFRPYVDETGKRKQTFVVLSYEIFQGANWLSHEINKALIKNYLPELTQESYNSYMRTIMEGYSCLASREGKMLDPEIVPPFYFRK